MGVFLSNLLPRRVLDTFSRVRVKESKHLQDDIDNKTEDAATQQRALLVGITHSNSSNALSRSDDPHGDVDQLREVLIGA